MPDVVLRRSLPVAPEAPPARRHLPLALDVRAVDNVQPIYAVWEITLRCDLACVHCGSRAGRARPGELTTAQCLDLVDQMAGLGVKEVTLIGGEAYLRDDWLQIVRALRRHGIQASMTTGGRGLTPERAAAAGLQSVSVSLNKLELGDERAFEPCAPAATSATPRCATSGSAQRRCAIRAIAPSTICGAIAAPVITPIPAWRVAPGLRSACLARRATTRFVTHRALEFQRHGKRERLVPVAPAPGQPFDNGRFDIVIEEIPA